MKKLSLLCLCYLFACESGLTPPENVPSVANELSISAFLNPEEDTLRVLVLRARGLDEPPYVSDPLRYRVSGAMVSLEAAGNTVSFQEAINDPGVYWAPLRAEPGRTYLLRVKVNHLQKEATAEATVPGPFAITTYPPTPLKFGELLELKWQPSPYAVGYLLQFQYEWWRPRSPDRIFRTQEYWWGTIGNPTLKTEIRFDLYAPLFQRFNFIDSVEISPDIQVLIRALDEHYFKAAAVHKRADFWDEEEGLELFATQYSNFVGGRGIFGAFVERTVNFQIDSTYIYRQRPN